ncbi:MAG: lipocalin-like domain-containing protein [Planctomycetota bacterium]|jgi:hypothetical protein
MKSRILALTISLLIIASTSAIVCAGDNSTGGVSMEENFGFVISPGGYVEGTSILDGTIGQGYYDVIWFFVLGAGNLHLEVEDCCIMGDTMIAVGDLIIGGPAPFMGWATSPDIISMDVSCPDFALGYMLVYYIDAPGGFPAQYYWRADMGGGPVCDIVGTWDLWYDWHCIGVYLYADWSIYSDGTFSSSGGSTGTWTLVGDQFTLYYDEGPTYRGIVAPGCTYMSGTMEGVYGTTGCWESFKTALPSTEASQGGDSIDAAGN